MKLPAIIVCYCILLFAAPAAAQERMCLAECIRIALENNYGIKVASTERDIASNDIAISQYLPTVAIDGSQNQAIMDSEIESSGSTNIINRGVVDAYNAGVSLNWRLFDGLAMFNEHRKQKAQFAESNQRLKMITDNLVASLCTEYYNILVQQKRLEAAQYSLTLSAERYEQAHERYIIGASSGLDLWQAKIDFNADSSKLMQQEETVRNAYVRLNTLMTTQLMRQGYVSDTIVLAPKMRYDDVRHAALAHNNMLLIARRGMDVSDYDLQIARAAFFPSLNFGAGYSFGLTEADKAITTYNRSNGLNWGFSLSWNIFSGFDVSRRVKKAKLNIKNQEYGYKQLENEVLGDITLLYNTYENNVLLIAFEQESAFVAATSLDIAMSRYKLGNLSGLEFRDYQKNYLDAIDRQWNAMYQAKISEISLRLMAGEL
jgi:outer membrane protein TolC